MNSLKSLGIQSYAVSCYLGFLGGGLGEGDLLEYLPPPGGDLKEKYPINAHCQHLQLVPYPDTPQSTIVLNLCVKF